MFAISFFQLIYSSMAAKQRMRVANEKYNKNITARGNVPKSLVSLPTLKFTITHTYH